MAVRSKRGLRSIFSRKYGHLGEKPIRVVDADDEDFVDGGCSFDRIIVCKSTDMEEETKDDDDDDDYVALTEKAAYAVVRDASALTELIASRIAKANCTSEQSMEEEKEDEPVEQPQQAKMETEEVPSAVIETEAATEQKPETEVAVSTEQTNKGLVETSKERVAAAFKNTQDKTSEIFEACISGGKDSMTSAEESTQAAIALPLTPFLEQLSERLELIMAQLALEAEEFFWDHWNMLQNCSAAVSMKFQKTPCGSVQNVIAENPMPNTTIEVQMQNTEE